MYMCICVYVGYVKLVILVFYTSLLIYQLGKNNYSRAYTVYGLGVYGGGGGGGGGGGDDQLNNACVFITSYITSDTFINEETPVTPRQRLISDQSHISGRYDHWATLCFVLTVKGGVLG